MAPYGACRVCVIEIEGAKKLFTACNTKVREGMIVYTHSKRVREARKVIVELLLANNHTNCAVCDRAETCELLALAQDLGIREVRFYPETEKREVDTTSNAIVRDHNKCILCNRCVRVCSEIQSVNAIRHGYRGSKSKIIAGADKGLGDSLCTYCGQCIHVCPVGALYERTNIEEVWHALEDSEKHVIVQVAPAVRVSLGEELGLKPGEIVIGKIYAALRILGFDAIFDTSFGADLTIMEEANELVARIKGELKKPLPQITSCCPSWIKFMEEFYPELMENVSSCKSPQQMFGAIAKTYYASKKGIDASKIVSVAIMPCTSKKFEASRPEMCASGYRDIDYVLTTREFAQMIREARIDFAKLPEENADVPLGIYSGAGAIFGTTGGVMEAALRTAYYLLTGKELSDADIEEVRGLEGIREATITINELKLNVAIAHGLGNARKLLNRVKDGKANYHFIEIMACPGGCVGGGGQPIDFSMPLRKTRSLALYKHDKRLRYRKSYENPAIKELYSEFLKKPLSELSHKLLHTRYINRKGVRF